MGYTYDSNGNLISDGVFTYTYDTANRLVQVLSGTLTIAFDYDGDGHRTAQVVDGVTTTYVVAVLGLPQALAETTGGETTRYLYGYGLLGEEDSAWAWHLGDGLNSLRQLAGDSGQVTLAQGYTPFGVPLWSEGDATSAHGFTGEQWQADAELLFLRARYYQPATGRFLSRDPFGGYSFLPISQHPYSYVLNNPLRYVDPSGFDSGSPPPTGTPPPPVPTPAPKPVPTPPHIPPPDYKNTRPGENPPPPQVPGLPDDEWEWSDNWDGNMGPGYRNRKDPTDSVWRPDDEKTSRSGREGEDPHWQRRRPGEGGQGERIPSNPGWGRGKQRPGPGTYDPATGRYVWDGEDDLCSLLIGSGVVVVIWYGAKLLSPVCGPAAPICAIVW